MSAIKELREIRTQKDRIAGQVRTAVSQMEPLASKDTLTAGEQRQFDDLNTRINKLEETSDGLVRREREILQEGLNSGELRGIEGSQPGSVEYGGDEGFDRDRGPLGQLRGEARRTIANAVRAGTLPDYAAEKATGLLETGTGQDMSIASRWAVATGDPAYLGAFVKLIADPTRGHMLWTNREKDAYQKVRELRTAMDTTSTHGAEMIPLTLDPAIMLTNAGSINPLRRISRVVTTASNTWQGVTSAGATAEWKAEGVQAADGSPDLASVSVPLFLADVDVVYSYEVEQDALSFIQELSRIMRDAVDNLVSTAYTTGGGSTAPQGIITGLAGTASEINGGGSEALDVGDPLLLQNALPARFSARAQWCANIAIINAIGAFETTNGALRFPEVSQGQLLRKPLNELSNMDGAINAAATANNYVLVYGDFQAGFVIVDKIGSTLEILPGFGANNRPTGQRHAFLTFRTGSEVVVPNAFRLLDVPTTA
jgi:HK97 family phage major capsid protein